MIKRPLVLLVVLASIAIAAVAVWRIQDTRAKESRAESESLMGLSAEDIRIVLASQADPSSTGIAENVETRRAFLKGMREYLALAAAARNEGMTEDPAFRINFEHKKNILLADLYQAKLSKDSGNPYLVPREVLDNVWKDAANERQFEIDIATMQEIQNTVARERGENFTVNKLQGGSLIKARDNWSRVRIFSEMAKKDPVFMSQPVIGLRTRILEAGILSADYLRKHWSKVKATEADIAEYLRTHPEYDVNLKREKAESVLKQAKAGADFARLAAEFSEDRTTKNKGGLYENIERNALWPEVESAALALEKGQIADRLIESETGFHIVKLESKQVGQDGGGTYSVRHILLQKKFEDPGNTNPEIPSPFLTASEIAKSEVEKEKRNRFVDQIVQRGDISLPEDFVVNEPADAIPLK